MQIRRSVISRYIIGINVDYAITGFVYEADLEHCAEVWVELLNHVRLGRLSFRTFQRLL